MLFGGAYSTVTTTAYIVNDYPYSLSTPISHLPIVTTTSLPLSTTASATTSVSLSSSLYAERGNDAATTLAAMLLITTSNVVGELFVGSERITVSSSTSTTTTNGNSGGGLFQMRLALTLTHILLVSLGSFLIRFFS